MLTENDINFMAESQDEIYTLRQRSINVIYLDKVIDEYTGAVISEDEEPREVSAVVTELSRRGKDARHMEGGIEYAQGGGKFDIQDDYRPEIADVLIRAEYDGEKYELLGADKKRIGRR